MEKWQAIQPEKNGDWELYDLAKDVSETNNFAELHPDLIKWISDPNAC